MPKVSDAHLEARRQQILDAAGRCFARAGFHRTSMQDIVKESGVSAGLVYRYFESKDDIIAAIVTQWHGQRQSMLDASDRPGASYVDMLRSIGTPQGREDARLGVQVWAEAVLRQPIHDLVQAGVDEPRARAADLLKHGGLPADLDPDSLVRVFIAIYQGLALQSALDDTVDHNAFTRTVEAILDALAH